MRAALLIAGTDLRRRLRNRSAIVVAVVGPLAMAVVFSLLLRGTSSATFKIGLVDADRSPATTTIVREFTAPPARHGRRSPVQFTTVADVAAARHQVDDNDLDAALVIRQGSRRPWRRGGPPPSSSSAAPIGW